MVPDLLRHWFLSAVFLDCAKNVGTVLHLLIIWYGTIPYHTTIAYFTLVGVVP